MVFLSQTKNLFSVMSSLLFHLFGCFMFDLYWVVDVRAVSIYGHGPAALLNIRLAVYCLSFLGSMSPSAQERYGDVCFCTVLYSVGMVLRVFCLCLSLWLCIASVSASTCRLPVCLCVGDPMAVWDTNAAPATWA